MKSGFNIVLFVRSDALPAATQSALQKAGHTTRMAESLDEAIEEVKELENGMLLAECGSVEDEIVLFVKQILAHDEIFHLPLTIVGKDVDSFERILDDHFEFSATLNVPVKARELTEAVDFLHRNYERSQTFVEEEDEVPEIPQDEEVQAEPARTEDRQTLIEELDSEIKSIPNMLFHQLEKLELIQKSIGGTRYASPIDKDFAEAEGLFPKDAKVREVADSVCDDAGKWGRLHLMRTAYIAKSIVGPLNLSEEHIEKMLSICYLHAWSFAGNESELLKKNYNRSENKVVRKELCSKIKDSAMKVASELSDPHLTELTAKFGRVIGEEDGFSEDVNSIITCAVMVADITDRTCYHSASWNSRSAYHLMKKFKSGGFKDLHDGVWGCIIKFLSEAIVARQAAWLLPKHIREDEALIEKAKETRDAPVEEHEMKVPLAVLKPGMRLSKPLYAFDGKQILPDDLILDQDLIWRIWQLSAVRPLNAPLVIRDDEFEDLSSSE